MLTISVGCHDRAEQARAATPTAAAAKAMPAATMPATAPDEIGDARTNCRRDALRCVDAFRQRDADAILAAMHPAARRRMPADIRDTMVSDFAEWKRRGVIFTNSLGDGPAEILAGSGDRRFAVIPQRTELRMPEGFRVQTPSYLLGVSVDRGRTWQFVDGMGTKSVPMTAFFPDYPIAAHPLPIIEPSTITRPDGTTRRAPS